MLKRAAIDRKNVFKEILSSFSVPKEWEKKESKHEKQIVNKTTKKTFSGIVKKEQFAHGTQSNAPLCHRCCEL